LEETKNDLLDFLTQNPNCTYLELCKLIYCQFKPNCEFDKFNSSILLDKNPSYTLYIKRLKDFNSESKFILLLRDYRSNVLSRKQSIYFKSPNVAFNAMRWKLFNKKALKFLYEIPEDYIYLKYEDLVNEQEEILFKVFDFFEIEKKIYPDLKTINSVTAEEFKISEKFKERFYKKYGDLKKEVFTNRAEAWKSQLSKHEIRICEAICGQFGQIFGYQQTENLNWTEKKIIKLIYIFPIFLAYLNIQKDLLLFRLSPKLKFKRLKQEYKKLGFIE
jgi:hypothetical protein